MMKEYELVVLTRDMPGHGLRAGDVGTVVHSYHAGACEVEFVSRSLKKASFSVSAQAAAE